VYAGELRDMNIRKRVALPVLLIASAVGCASLPSAEKTVAQAEQMISTAYSGMPEVLTERAVQDASQKLCSKGPSGKLTSDEAALIVKSARASMKYPASGKLIGDWKVGEQLVSNGVGMRVREGRVEQVKQNGALCTNCHALDPKDVNVGNLGPSLIGYGTQRGRSEAMIKYTYEKIYNAWVYYPCSNMPRLGNNGYLTPDQITQVVSYLLDAESPVNKK
jgi:L-cysteine S-thiosulfotransferase